ncbi:MAG: hypothetical protein ACK56F_18420 [bacterium]
MVAGLLRPRPPLKQIEQTQSNGKFRERNKDLQTCDSPGGGVVSNGEHDGVQLETVLLDDV